jgi:hypothetical protein
MVAKGTAYGVFIEKRQFAYTDIEEGIISKCILRKGSGLNWLRRKIFSRIFSTRSQTFQ